MVFSSIINLFRLIGMHWHRHIDTRGTPYLILQDLAGAGGLLWMGSTHLRMLVPRGELWWYTYTGGSGQHTQCIKYFNYIYLSSPDHRWHGGWRRTKENHYPEIRCWGGRPETRCWGGRVSQDFFENQFSSDYRKFGVCGPDVSCWIFNKTIPWKKPGLT